MHQAAPRLQAPGMDDSELQHLLTWVQDGVVSRRQVLQLRGTDADIARMLRRRQLSVVHPGVYVDHTGPLSWRQRAWAAVLFYWPAALARESALPRPPADAAVHVAVDLGRTVRPVRGVLIHRTADFAARVRWNASPPKIALEHAVVDVAAGCRDPLEQFRVLAEACQTRETRPSAIAAAVRARRRVRDRTRLLELLADLETGACSVLEREYLQLERRHGLPTQDRRQRPDVIAGRAAYRDVDHSDFGLVVELDGKAFHDNPRARDRDFARDLETVVTSAVTTMRLTYGQVFRDGCATIHKISTLLERGGWPGALRTCEDCPTSRRAW